MMLSSDCRAEIGPLVVSSAKTFLYLREKTGHNDAPEIDMFHKYLGLDNQAEIKRYRTGYSWCAAFVDWQYKTASEQLGIKNPLYKTPRVYNLWKYARANELKYTIIYQDDLVSGTIKGRPGDVMIMRHGPVNTNWNGHTGVIELPTTTFAATIEGNTNGKGERESTSSDQGVWRKKRTFTSMEGLIRVKENAKPIEDKGKTVGASFPVVQPVEVKPVPFRNSCAVCHHL
jgi:hypothetical protein